MSDIDRAVEIAVGAHKGQTDKHGQPYLLHPLRVMAMLGTPEGMMAGVLHDVVEDSDAWTIEALAAEGFPEAVVQAVDRLTRRAGEPYDDFIRRIQPDPLAVQVKLADLRDNMDVRRWRRVGDQDLERLSRYHRAWRTLAAQVGEAR